MHLRSSVAGVRPTAYANGRKLPRGAEGSIAGRPESRQGGNIFNAFTVRRYFFDWLVDLAYCLAGASRLVLILPLLRSRQPELSRRERDN